MNELKIPRENVNDDVVLITKTLFTGEAFVKAGQVLIEIETSKSCVALEAPRDGFISMLVNEGDEVKVDEIYAIYQASNPKNYDQLEAKPSGSIEKSSPTSNEHIISEKATYIMEGRESVKNLEQLGHWVTSRSFKDGSSTKKFKAKNINNGSDEKKANAKVISELPLTKAKVSIRKRSEIKSLSLTDRGGFQSCLGIELKVQSRIVPDLIFGNSIQDLVCYETGKLLSKNYKDLNAFYSGENEISIYDEIHAGISLDKGGQLTVACIPNSNKLSLAETRNMLSKIYILFDEDKLTTNDLKPSTFTITDLSNTKCGYVLPLINGLQAFIIGIVRNIAGYSLFVSFDHRVTDGLRVSGFMENLKERLEIQFEDLNKQELVCEFCKKSLEEEKRLGHRGLIQMVTGNDIELICRSCFDGW